MWKRTIAFYGHLIRTKPKRLAKRIFDHFDKNPGISLLKAEISEKKDLTEIKVTKEYALGRAIFRKQI